MRLLSKIKILRLAWWCRFDIYIIAFGLLLVWPCTAQAHPSAFGALFAEVAAATTAEPESAPIAEPVPTAPVPAAPVEPAAEPVPTAEAASALTPHFRYVVSFKTILDNLEDSWPYLSTRTIVGSTLTPMVGVQVGRHALLGGAFLNTRYGTSPKIKAEPRLYYQYKDEHFMVAAGLFSRDLMKPSRLFHYTTAYKVFNNTLHGFLGQYTTETGYAEALIDWYLADAAHSRDGFILRVSGCKRFGGWFLDGQFSYHHRADTALFKYFNVFDRLQYDFRLGYDFARLQTVFRSLYLTAGFVGDADQKRLYTGFKLKPGFGFETALNIDWKGLYVRNTFYYGQSQMPFYAEYGSELYSADPFYRSAFYDQLAVGYVYKYKWVSVGAHVLLFFVDAPKVANQQQLTLSFDLDEVVRRKK